MARKMDGARRPSQANWLVRAPGKLERIEACLWGSAFTPHRHDTYAIGITMGGIQSFDYRGSPRASSPGQVVVLHPDELHDGRAGDGNSFRYRTTYVAPARMQEILGGRPLPFVAGGVSNDARLKSATLKLLENYDRPLDEAEEQDALFELTMTLEAVAGTRAPVSVVNRAAAVRARAYIDSHLKDGFSLEELERETGHQRWQLSRDFRKLFGTSPYRYLVARRLDKARALIAAGQSGAAAAHTCGFADQSHFGRAFRQAFGMTPLNWAKISARLHDRSIRAPAGRSS